MIYFVETYRPPYPAKGVKVRVFTNSEYARDALHPTMTAVFEIKNVNSKNEAMAVVIEHAAGITHNTTGATVRKVFGGR